MSRHSPRLGRSSVAGIAIGDGSDDESRRDYARGLSPRVPVAGALFGDGVGGAAGAGAVVAGSREGDAVFGGEDGGGGLGLHGLGVAGPEGGGGERAVGGGGWSGGHGRGC